MFNTAQDSYLTFRNLVSERTNPVVAWVGSGLSKPAGLPDWSGLRDELCRTLESTLDSFDERQRNQKQNQLIAARTQGNLWLAFQILRKALGATTYRSTIRRSLRPADTAAIPPLYRAVWALSVSGVITTNLDQFVARAHGEVLRGRKVHEFDGKRAGDLLHILKGATPFIANLHGIAAEESSWVFTRSDLDNLLADVGYKQFVRACLTTRTVFFVGISADDVAVGGHLSALTREGIDFGEHYWITTNQDPPVRQWAEKVGLRVIHYVSEGENRHEELRELFDDLVQYVSVDDVPPPVVPSSNSSSTAIPNCDELLRLSSDEIRHVLNEHAASILASKTDGALRQYEQLWRDYDEAIHRAWYVKVQPPANRLMDYTLTDEIATGAFGKVYEARDSQGHAVAIKLLRSEVRDTAGMLESFRRGVRSMRILSDRHVKGMVPYREAAEIPAFVVMDLVRGPDLRAAVEQRLLDDWSSVIRVGADLTRIVRSAHMLPERVLHRDIRPSNIMLAGYYDDPSDWNLVVLDFDLSWHRDALEKTVLQGQHVSGYLAPEQYQRSDRVSTRSALVDSYGLGMTLYFVATAREPVVAEHKHTEWASELQTRVGRRDCATWRSLPRRFARLIEHATCERQSDRWDVAAMLGELERLGDCLSKPKDVGSAELIAEELLTHTNYADRYLWDSERMAGIVTLPTGVTLSIEGVLADSAIRMLLCWQERRTGEQKRVDKWMSAAISAASASLRKAGWTLDVDRGQSSHEFRIWATASAAAVRKKFDLFAQSIDGAMHHLEFS